MGVDLQVGRLVAVAGDVDVTDARRGQRTQEFVRVVAVVGGVDDDVVDVQQQVAVGLGEHRVDEVDLVHRLEGRGVVGEFLHRDPPAGEHLRGGGGRRDGGG